MAHAYQHELGGPWYAGFQDERGARIIIRTTARTREQAESLAAFLEQASQRLSLGEIIQRRFGGLSAVE